MYCRCKPVVIFLLNSLQCSKLVDEVDFVHTEHLIGLDKRRITLASKSFLICVLWCRLSEICWLVKPVFRLFPAFDITLKNTHWIQCIISYNSAIMLLYATSDEKAWTKSPITLTRITHPIFHKLIHLGSDVNKLKHANRKSIFPGSELTVKTSCLKGRCRNTPTRNLKIVLSEYKVPAPQTRYVETILA